VVNEIYVKKVVNNILLNKHTFLLLMK